MLKIAGDISLTDGYFDAGFGVGSRLAAGLNPFCHLRKEGDECWIGIFEGVAADVTNKKGTAAKHFRVSPHFIACSKMFDVYGFANNHAMQHGAQAYAQTLLALEKNGAMCFGMKEKKSIVFEHQKKLVSITGFSQRIDTWEEDPAYWHNPEFNDIEKELAVLPHNAFKILFVHWGKSSLIILHHSKRDLHIGWRMQVLT